MATKHKTAIEDDVLPKIGAPATRAFYCDLLSLRVEMEQVSLRLDIRMIA